MKNPTTAYLALGSNQGNKLQFLQRAVSAIFKQIGEVTAVSSVYKTPAFGFDGNDFFNACVKIKTRFSAEKTLEKLLQIEDILGRQRTKSDTYENRVIDLDLIFFGIKIISS